MADDTYVGPAQLRHIPPFPPVATRLLNLLGRSETNLLRVEATLRTDPALASEVLRRANSPVFGLTSRVDSIHQALLLLGVDWVRQLALTVAARSFVDTAARVEQFQRCWRHTLATAFLADEIAWAADRCDERAYMAGLLHDLGRLGLMIAQPQEYARLLQVVRRNSFDILDFERELFGLDHCEAGRRLCKVWQLPADYRVICGRHHDSLAAGPITLLSITHLACRMADALGFSAFDTETAPAMEAILLTLPATARERFCPDLEAMRLSLEAELESFEHMEPRSVKVESHPAPPPAPISQRPRAGFTPAPPPQPEIPPPSAPGDRRLHHTVTAVMAGIALALLWMTYFYR